MQTLQVNNSKILAIRNAKSLGRYVYMNLNKDFQICISILLSAFLPVKLSDYILKSVFFVKSKLIFNALHIQTK